MKEDGKEYIVTTTLSDDTIISTKATKNDKTPKKVSNRPKMTEEEWFKTESEILGEQIN